MQLSLTRASRAAASVGAGFAGLLVFATPAFAVQSPPGCTADNSVVNIASDVSTAAEGETITFTVRAGNPASADGCDITGRTMTLTLPDGTQSVFGPINYPNPTALQFVGSAPYVANNAHAVGGFWTANVSWNGTLKSSSDLPSSGSKNASVVQHGRIIVDKVTDPAADPQSFAFTTTGTGYTGFSLTDAATPNEQVLDAGTYSVAETAVAGWDSNDGVCVSSKQDVETPGNISLQPGETVTCTFTNTKQGHIIVDKVTVPAADPESFAFTTTGTGYNSFNLTDVAIPNDQALAAGSYSVGETAEDGWTETNATCVSSNEDVETPGNISLQAGETVTCTFTNTKESTVIVKKVMVGGTSTFDFTGTPSGSISSNNGTISAVVAAGQHVSTETPEAGWDLTSVVCDDTDSVGNEENGTATFNVAAGETVTCTFTNTKQTGNIIIVKQTDPNGDPQSFTFDPSYGNNFNLVDNGQNNSGALDAGTYSVAEINIPANWALSSATCSDGSTVDNIQLGAGETVTCTFNNTYTAPPGRIIVVKQTNPDGDPQSFEFDSSYGSNFTLADNGQNDSGELEAGTYSVAEINIPANWALSNVTCSDGSSANSINLAAGETVTCTFTNTYTPPAGEYCSPGYWKQPQHFDSWEGYTPEQKFSSVFEGVTINWSAKGKPGAVADPTLLQALEGNGGGITSLARAAVGALLNASALESSLSEQDVIDIFNDANPSGNFEAAKAQYTFPENCPLN